MATFGISTFGRSYLHDEGTDINIPAKIIMMIITGVLGLSLTFKAIIFYKTCPSHKNNSLARWIFIIHLISYTIHSIHFVDNIYRPVAYYEPEWLYKKYLVAPMEITFTANFPISYLFIRSIQEVQIALQNKNRLLISKSSKLTLYYIFGSLLTLGHYRTEPPTTYSAFVNFTIAGEGLATIILATLVIFVWRKSVSNQELNEDGQIFLEDISESEEEEQYSRKSLNLKKEGARRRSTTPG